MSDTLLNYSSFISSKRNRQKVVFFDGDNSFQFNRTFLNHEKILEWEIIFVKYLLAFRISLRSGKLRYLVYLVVMENLDEIHMRKENRHFIVLSLPKYVGRLLEFMFVNFEND